MPRHKKLQVDSPDWVDKLAPNEDCLRSVAEDVYYAKALAEKAGAYQKPACIGKIKEAEKALKILENKKDPQDLRCSKGDKAARKFWEAKVCARAP